MVGGAGSCRVSRRGAEAATVDGVGGMAGRQGVDFSRPGSAIQGMVSCWDPEPAGVLDPLCTLERGLGVRLLAPGIGAGSTTKSRNSGWFLRDSNGPSLERLTRTLLASPRSPSLRERR